MDRGGCGGSNAGLEMPIECVGSNITVEEEIMLSHK